MIEIEERLFGFRLKEVYFADRVFDVAGYASAAFHNCRQKLDVPGFTYSQGLTSVVDLTAGLETIWKNMEAKSCRYPVRRAERERVKVGIAPDFGPFYDMYRSFNRQMGLGSERPEIMKRYGTLFTADTGGRLLAGNVYLEDADFILFWYGASRRLEVSKDEATLIGCASRLIHWEAMKYARGKGIKEFDFGGLSPGPALASINAFKESFGGRRVVRHNYRKDYSRLYVLGREARRYVRRYLRV